MRLSRGKRGFTLIELLVVISIIALLLSILMPALSRVKEAAQGTVCKTNLKQVTLAAMLWSEDHNDYVVAGMWHVPAVHPDWDTGMGSSIRAEATSRGASLEPYTSTEASIQKNLYSCPTAAKFKENFFCISTSIYAVSGVERRNTVAFGVNSFAVTYTEDTYIGAKGEMGGPEATYPGWGKNDVYMLEHGKAKLSQIKGGASKVYFTDFSYPVVYSYMYNPLKVCYWNGSYGFVDTFANVPAGASIVQARWHGSASTSTGYGDSNIAWFDCSVSAEPADFDDATPIRKSGGGFGGGTTRYLWQKYFYNQ